jgi:hypothetical protein
MAEVPIGRLTVPGRLCGSWDRDRAYGAGRLSGGRRRAAGSVAGGEPIAYRCRGARRLLRKRRPLTEPARKSRSRELSGAGARVARAVGTQASRPPRVRAVVRNPPSRGRSMLLRSPSVSRHGRVPYHAWRRPIRHSSTILFVLGYIGIIAVPIYLLIFVASVFRVTCWVSDHSS